MSEDPSERERSFEQVFAHQILLRARVDVLQTLVAALLSKSGGLPPEAAAEKLQGHVRTRAYELLGHLEDVSPAYAAQVLQVLKDELGET